MARTKGAKDKRPRKAPSKRTTRKVVKKVTPARRPASKPAGTPAETPAANARKDTPPAVPQSVDEFNQAIDAALGVSQAVSPSPGDSDRPAAGDSVGEHGGSPGPSLIEQEAPLTREAWQGVLRVPFRVLGLALAWSGLIDEAGQKAIGLVAEKRAPDLARPSYVLFEHYAKQYAGMDPDNPISLAWAATGLVAASIAEELTEVIVVSRQLARQRRQAPAPPTDGQDGQG